MTAYVLSASGDWNNPLIWTPNGVPAEPDTFTAGVFALTIPAGYTAKIAGFVMTGTATGTRSILTIAGKLELYGNCSSTNFADIRGVGNCEIDLRGFSFEIGTALDDARVKVSNDAAGIFKIWSSTTLGYFGRPVARQKSAAIELDKFLIINTAFRCGGSLTAGENYTLKNGIFYNCGLIDMYEYIQNAANWIIENVDYRVSQVASAYNLLLGARSSGGTVTGIRSIKNVTIDYRTSTIKKFRMLRFNASIVMDGMYTAGAYFEGISSEALTIDKYFCAPYGLFGEGGFTSIKNTYVFENVNNPHTMENTTKLTVMEDFVIESIQPLGATDAGDHFICTPGTGVDSTFRRGLIIDNRGGVLLNALKANTIGTYLLEHCTYVADVETAVYGHLARNESGQIFQAAANTTIRSCIDYVRSNPSGAANIRAVNFETAGDDQLDYFDYNLLTGLGSDDSIVYFGVTSATKGAMGSQEGWGLNVLRDVNPMFVDENRGLVSWGATQGFSGINETINGILNSVNGYNDTTKTQTGNVVGRSVTEIIDWVSAGFVPQNAAISTAAHDGTTPGAFAYQAPPSSGGEIKLTGRKITATKISATALMGGKFA